MRSGGVRSVVWIAAAALMISACSSSATRQYGARSDAPGPTATPPEATTEAAVGFLDRYATADGRVVRLDQGGDIVSEGAALGLLASEIAGRPATARTIWAWTARHLQRPDGLFAFHARWDGTILDPQPAPDADIVIAYALLRYRGPDDQALHDEGSRVAREVMNLEAVTIAGASPVITAGLWAKSTPAIVDPSYWMPPVFRALANLTGDRRWAQTADASVALIGGVTADGRVLPPDWAHLDTSRLDPIPAPSGGAAVQYGADAARLPLWFAADCSASARHLAAHWWIDVLSVGDRTSANALSLTGQVVDPSPSPLSLLAGAAAAQAAGATSRAGELRALAADQAGHTRTYYGDAWVALGSALLDRSLTPC